MKRAVETILKVGVTILLGVWIFIVLTDFNRTKAGKDPKFCLHRKVKKYSDGETFICWGLGYKTFRYNRSCGGIQFSPFFFKEKTIEELCNQKIN